MKFKCIRTKFFDLVFTKTTKKRKNVITGRLYLESIEENKKPAFLINLITSFKPILGIAYRILFWEKNEVIETFLKTRFKCEDYKMVKLYKNRTRPGILYIEHEIIDETFLNILLNVHFNYELAKDPSLSIRPQIYIIQENSIILFDIYDDRGLDIYYYLNLGN